jgi:hypothetical protein
VLRFVRPRVWDQSPQSLRGYVEHDWVTVRPSVLQLLRNGGSSASTIAFQIVFGSDFKTLTTQQSDVSFLGNFPYTAPSNASQTGHLKYLGRASQTKRV